MDKEAYKRGEQHFLEGLEVRRNFWETHKDIVVEVAKKVAAGLTCGSKILLCGNGGSAADAQHIAAEFVNRYKMERPPLPAIALTTDSSILTAIGNDYSFADVFVKQVKALGLGGDFLFGISTSGKSANVLAALAVAREREMITVGFCGAKPSLMQDHCDYLFLVPSEKTPIIQEVHIAIGHILCELIDYFLFEDGEALEKYIDDREDF
ncbi:D-sedoheptulose 7-phosphate isomerase [Desulfonauticus submarinus]|uniref:Phosphoheptose isomerase n=1 Tax=Desulfonauticus submarinus TaxID=206665 RepID=A0A1H0D2Y2_9BACT|nr:D-sedoheptulose 7-phosphate isomerase [Desulfonauticus submarinus]SDN64542.1 D-sedoheptulose 7-phosphate isomerase [Desulfonauticus submarinus]